MKTFLFLLTLSASLSLWSQHIYGSISSGYLLNARIDQQPSYIVNTSHQVSLPWFWRQENYAFKNSLHTDLNFGHLITEQIGYELSFSYLKPNSVSDNFGYGQKIMSGAFFQSAAKLILSVPLKKFDLYAKVGLNIVKGKMSYLQTIEDGNFNSLGTSTASMTYTYTCPASLGYNGAIGINVPVSKKFSFFTEVRYIKQTFSPKNGKMSGYSYNGSDLFTYNDFQPYDAQIAFGTESEWQNYTSTDNSKPQKLYARSYALGGLDFTIGLKYQGS
ncbi:MAG: hypothetical protein RL331_479 [Bacteroidota bacterium]|jgi:hypothetical protein